MKEAKKKEFTPEELALAREEHNAYLRAWRAAHPDAVREHNHQYWVKRSQSRKKGSV